MRKTLKFKKGQKLRLSEIEGLTILCTYYPNFMRRLLDKHMDNYFYCIKDFEVIIQDSGIEK